MASKAYVASLTLSELKRELKQRGLSARGSKRDLRDRLEQALDEEELDDPSSESDTEGAVPLQGTGFNFEVLPESFIKEETPEEEVEPMIVSVELSSKENLEVYPYRLLTDEGWGQTNENKGPMIVAIELKSARVYEEQNNPSPLTEGREVAGNSEAQTMAQQEETAVEQDKGEGVGSGQRSAQEEAAVKTEDGQGDHIQQASVPELEMPVAVEGSAPPQPASSADIAPRAPETCEQPLKDIAEARKEPVKVESSCMPDQLATLDVKRKESHTLDKLIPLDAKLEEPCVPGQITVPGVSAQEPSGELEQTSQINTPPESCLMEEQKCEEESMQHIEEVERLQEPAQHMEEERLQELAQNIEEEGLHEEVRMKERFNIPAESMPKNSPKSVESVTEGDMREQSQREQHEEVHPPEARKEDGTTEDNREPDQPVELLVNAEQQMELDQPEAIANILEETVEEAEQQIGAEVLLPPAVAVESGKRSQPCDKGSVDVGGRAEGEGVGTVQPEGSMLEQPVEVGEAEEPVESDQEAMEAKQTEGEHPLVEQQDEVVADSSGMWPPACEESEVLPPANEENEVLPPASEESGVLPPASEESGVLPPASEESGVLPPASEESGVLPPASEESGVLPPACEESGVLPPACEESGVLPPASEESGVLPPASEESGVLPPASEESGVLPPASEESGVLPPASEESGVLPPASEESGVLPPASEESGVLPPASEESGVLPPASEESGVLPPASEESGVLPPASEESGVLPPASEESGVLPPASEESGVLPPASEESGVLPPASEESGVLPPASEESGVLPPASEESGVLPPASEESGVLPPASEESWMLPSASEESGVLPPAGEESGVLPPASEESGVLPPASEDLAQSMSTSDSNLINEREWTKQEMDAGPGTKPEGETEMEVRTPEEEGLLGESKERGGMESAKGREEDEPNSHLRDCDSVDEKVAQKQEEEEEGKENQGGEGDKPSQCEGGDPKPDSSANPKQAEQETECVEEVDPGGESATRSDERAAGGDADREGQEVDEAKLDLGSNLEQGSADATPLQEEGEVSQLGLESGHIDVDVLVHAEEDDLSVFSTEAAEAQALTTTRDRDKKAKRSSSSRRSNGYSQKREQVASSRSGNAASQTRKSPPDNSKRQREHKSEPQCEQPSIKRRRISTQGSSSVDNSSSVGGPQERRRRWGSAKQRSGSTSATTISSDVLKDIIPAGLEEEGGVEGGGVAAATSALDSVMGYGGEEEEGEVVSEKGTGEEETEGKGDQLLDTEHQREWEEVEKEREVKRRAVERARQEVETRKRIEARLRAKQQVEAKLKMDEKVKRRTPSPARNPPNRILHVEHLTRPFTVMQLKELLTQDGPIISDSFWTNKIKSHCIVLYKSQESAVATRTRIHGIKWPSTNPKLLCAEYLTPGDVERITKGEMVVTMEKEEVEEETEEKEEEGEVVRESGEEGRMEVEEEEEGRGGEEVLVHDASTKIRQASTSSPPALPSPKGVEKRAVEREVSPPPAKETDKTTKLLDELFRKTKTTPSIYWLPLNDVQVKERQDLMRAREAEREKQRQERARLRQEEREREAKERREREERDRRERERRIREERERRARERMRRRSRSRSRSRSRDRRRR